MQLDFSTVAASIPFLLTGLKFTLELTAAAFIGGLILGTALALFRHLNVPFLSGFSVAYVTVMRSIPLIMVLFWLFFLLPLFLQFFSPDNRPVPIGPVYTAFITFTLFEAAYFCEIIRAGLNSVPKGQYEAADALAMSSFQVYTWIILPQVIKTSTPIILTQLIILFQDTSLVYVLSLTDLLGAATKLGQRDSKLTEYYIIVAAIYFIISSLASELVTWYAQRRRALPLMKDAQ
ncbi:amino acid ABC transporter permease [Brenneria roseae subsp. americana]|uniref:Glutamate/aspartate import permease protein GltK n=1 Tax=Brenneria roseae subsp. americana TaxID=1508507 RepID=A0A2U1TP02_9GAMM|nr:amino acid ABC transporter permease [Brenneria roseae]PWC11092.1 amino acid ABC transporter permease [Brenneria roseae subsp. americana]